MFNQVNYYFFQSRARFSRVLNIQFQFITVVYKTQREVASINKFILVITTVIIMKLAAICFVLAISYINPSKSILSGRQIDIRQAPYMVWIEEIVDISEGKAYECGGSIIKDKAGENGKRVSKFVLTAAHCVVDENNNAKSPDNFILVAGSTNKAQPGPHGQVFNGVGKVHLHPKYSGPDTPHDMAILELSDGDELQLDGRYKKAVKLAGKNEQYPVGTEVSASGWGTNPNTTDENYLYQTTMKVRSYKKCASQYGDDITEASLKEHQICALGGPPDYSNICKVCGRVSNCEK